MRGTLSATAVLAAGLLLTACGAKTHENEPRPPVPSVINISLADDNIEVTPKVTGIPGKRPVNISQNENAPIGPADPDAPAVVEVVVSSLIPRATKLILEGPVDTETPLTANGPSSFKKALPTGVYRLSSPASSATARFAIGPARVSSASDLLTP